MRTSKSLKSIVFLVILMMALPLISHGAMLAWDAPEEDVAGYKVYYSVTQGLFQDFIDVGNVTQCSLDQFPLQEKNTYYFVVSAYNSAGESGFSNGVDWTQPDVTPPLPPQGVSVD